MFVWDRGPRAVIEVLLESTGPLYVSEIIQRSTIGEATVYRVLERLHEHDMVIREKEGFTLDSGRAPRVYYSLSPSIVEFFRLD